MDTIPAGDPTLDDVLLFNDYLLKLTQAGVPIGLDGVGTTEDLLVKLSRINSSFAIGIARGSSVRQILESSKELPFQYRTALAIWLFCDRSPDAFMGLNECANGRRDLEKLVSYSLLQPLLLSVLAFIGFLLMLVYLSPKIEALSNQMHAMPGLGLRFLMAAKQTMWIWGIAVPILIVLGILFWQQNRSHWKYLSIPGRQGIAEMNLKANYADSIASLIEHNHTEADARNVIGPMHSNLATVPPLLQWAMGSDVGIEERVNALQATARAYRNMAQSRSCRLSVWFPIVISAMLGGTLVLLYGLSLFVPLIELLIAITQPKN